MIVKEIFTTKFHKGHLKVTQRKDDLSSPLSVALCYP